MVEPIVQGIQYGSYTVMELVKQVVIDVQLVQVSVLEIKGGYSHDTFMCKVMK